MDVDEDLSFDFAHPEILSRDALQHQLIKRGLAPSSCATKDKDELLQEYYKHACPMPQRKYRMNRRGRVMARGQVIISKRKRTHLQMNEADQHKGRSYTYAVSTGNQDQPMETLPKSGLINQFNLPTSGGDRLKPPPIAINPEKRVVKLGGNKQTEAKVSPTSERQKITFNNGDHNKSQISANQNSNSDLDNVVINTDIKRKTPKTTGLDNVVINSNFTKNDQNKSRSSGSDNSGDGRNLCNHDSLEMDAGVNKDTVSSTTEQKSSVKIKLKRRSDIKIPSTEEIFAHSGIDTNGCSEAKDKGTNGDTISEKTKPVLVSPQQRQLNLINQTIKQVLKSEEEKIESAAVEIKNDDEEEVVTKKFKRVAISWP